MTICEKLNTLNFCDLTGERCIQGERNIKWECKWYVQYIESKNQTRQEDYKHFHDYSQDSQVLGGIDGRNK
jgi:hypothetical protein